MIFLGVVLLIVAILDAAIDGLRLWTAVNIVMAVALILRKPT